MSPIIDEKQLGELIKMLRRPKTKAFLMEKFGVCEKTLYNYMNVLTERGYKIYRVPGMPPSKYLLLWPSVSREAGGF